MFASEYIFAGQLFGFDICLEVETLGANQHQIRCFLKIWAAIELLFSVYVLYNFLAIYLQSAKEILKLA